MSDRTNDLYDEDFFRFRKLVVVARKVVGPSTVHNSETDKGRKTVHDAGTCRIERISNNTPAAAAPRSVARGTNSEFMLQLLADVGTEYTAWSFKVACPEGMRILTINDIADYMDTLSSAQVAQIKSAFQKGVKRAMDTLYNALKPYAELAAKRGLGKIEYK